MFDVRVDSSIYLRLRFRMGGAGAVKLLEQEFVRRRLHCRLGSVSVLICAHTPFPRDSWTRSRQAICARQSRLTVSRRADEQTQTTGKHAKEKAM